MDEESIREQLTQVINEHRDLDEMITRLLEDPHCDRLKVQRLKKRKLSLRDQIQALSNQLIPDIIA